MVMVEEISSYILRKLVKDAELRRDYEAKLEIQTKIADGTVLYSNERGMQEILKVAHFVLIMLLYLH